MNLARPLLPLLSAAAFILAAAAPGDVPVTSTVPPAPPELDACYALEANAPGQWADADVYMLPDQAPVTLEADLKTTAPLPSGWRETSRSIRWTAGEGEVRPGPDPAAGTAGWTWIPPERSRVVDLTAEALIDLGPAPGSRGRGPLRISKRVPFRFLTPLPSSQLDAKGFIDGYEMGVYPDPKKAKGDEGPWIRQHGDRYALPEFFYRVDKDDKALRISPSLTLGHFTIDYPWGSLGMPQYLTIDPNLILKLEDLFALMRDDGIKVTSPVPIYGFRSPRFNGESIDGRPDTNLKVRYSMHQYGRALDFIIDEDGDLVMDDLNGDGKSDIMDSAAVMHYVNILDRRYRDEGRMEMVGGAGLYDHHDFLGRAATPYIHVDTRGFLGGNGNLIRWPNEWPGTREPIRWSKI